MDDVSNDLKDFHSLHPHRKLAVFAIIFLVFVVSIVVGIYLSNSKSAQNDAMMKKEAMEKDMVTVNKDGTTTLSLEVANSTAKVGQPVTVNVMLSGTPVVASDIFVNFDADMVTVSDIQDGDVYSELFRKEIEESRIKVAGNTGIENPQNVKTGRVFSFTVTGKKAGDSKLDFDLKRTTTSKSVNILGKVKPLTLTFTN